MSDPKKYNELETDKSYWMMEPGDAEWTYCSTTGKPDDIQVWPEGYREEHGAAHFRDYMFVEIVKPTFTIKL